MKLKELLSKPKANELFLQNAVLFGDLDYILESTVADMFGADALKFAHAQKGDSSRWWNIISASGQEFPVLTYKGFLAAVSFHNLTLLHVKQQSKLLSFPQESPNQASFRVVSRGGK